MYYHHTTLTTLKQDDLYSILWFGGVAGGVLFVLMVLAISLKIMGGLNSHRGDSIIGATVSAFIRTFIVIVFWLFFVVFVYMAILYGTSGSSGLNVAESMEWFLHTDWLGQTDTLLKTLDSIKPYGDEAITIAENTIGLIYIVKLLWLLTLFGFALLITVSSISKVNKMSNENRVNTLEYSATLATGGALGAIILVGVLYFINCAINETFILSDKVDGTSISSYDASVQHIYLDALSETMLNNAINTMTAETTTEITSLESIPAEI